MSDRITTECPDGYFAQESAPGDCTGCAFMDEQQDCQNWPAKCYAKARSDGKNVIFLKDIK